MTAPMPERTCCRCGKSTTDYQFYSIDAKNVECAERCLAARERQDVGLREAMLNENNAAMMPKKRTPHVSYEWVPHYD